MTIITIPNNYHVDITLPVIKRNGFGAAISYLVQGLPEGVTYNFTPANTSGIMNSQTVLTLYVSNTAVASTQDITVTGFPSGKTALLFTLVVPVRSAVPTTRAPATLNIIPPLDYNLPGIDYSTPFTINSNGWLDSALNFSVFFSNPAFTGTVSRPNGNYQLNISNLSRISGSFTGNLVLQNNNTYTSSSVGFSITVHADTTTTAYIPTTNPPPASRIDATIQLTSDSRDAVFQMWPLGTGQSGDTQPPIDQTNLYNFSPGGFTVGAYMYTTQVNVITYTSFKYIITSQSGSNTFTPNSGVLSFVAGQTTYLSSNLVVATTQATQATTVNPAQPTTTTAAATTLPQTGTIRYSSNIPNSSITVTGSNSVVTLTPGTSRANMPVGNYSYTISGTDGYVYDSRNQSFVLDSGVTFEVFVIGSAPTAPTVAPTTTTAPTQQTTQAYGSIVYTSNIPGSSITLTGPNTSFSLLPGQSRTILPPGNYTYTIANTNGYTYEARTQSFILIANAIFNVVVNYVVPTTTIRYGTLSFDNRGGYGADLQYQSNDVISNNGTLYATGFGASNLSLPVGTYNYYIPNAGTYTPYAGEFTINSDAITTISVFITPA